MSYDRNSRKLERYTKADVSELHQSPWPVWGETFSCENCGETHTLQFVPFSDPIGKLFTHWAMCPVNLEPLLRNYRNAKAIPRR